MKKVLELVFTASVMQLALVSFAHSPAETNAVLAVMLGRASESIWFDDYTHGIPDWLPDCSTRQSFFKVHSNESWTIEEKMGAFDDYLDSLSRANRSVTNELFRYANVAFIQCDALSYTNAVPALRRAAVNPYLSKVLYRSSAIEAAVRMGGVSDEATDFVEYIMTNSVPYTTYQLCEASITNEMLRMSWFPYTRHDLRTACFEYVALLDEEGSGEARDRAIRMLYRNRFNWRLSARLDRFFEQRIAGYASSSNRLAYLSWAISNSPDRGGAWDDSDRIKLIGITNQLLQMANPLPEIEELKGL